jgi:hypothetical protein
MMDMKQWRASFGSDGTVVVFLLGDHPTLTILERESLEIVDLGVTFLMGIFAGHRQWIPMTSVVRIESAAAFDAEMKA